MPSPLKKSFAAEQLKLRKKKKSFRNKLYAGILVVIVVIGGYIAYNYYMHREKTLTETIKQIRISIVPDTDYDSDKDQYKLCYLLTQSISQSLLPMKVFYSQ